MGQTKTRSRAKNLSDVDIAEIVSILDGWTGRLSWDQLIDSIEERKHVRYTRQALHKHERIKHAFVLRKKLTLASNGEIPATFESPELQAALERLERLKAENIRLTGENQRLLEQFSRWAYNAHTRGLDMTFLSRPLPSVNRDQTQTSLKATRLLPRAGRG